MQQSIFTAKDKTSLTLYTWECNSPIAIVHIIHGMSEHAKRYNSFAQELNKHRITVYAHDLRGHGETAGTVDKVGFFSEENGWQKVVTDVKEITYFIKQQNADLPIYILGHSMGSFVARTLFLQEPMICNGLILSGTTSHPGAKGIVGKYLSKMLAITTGKRKTTKLLNNLGFAGFNKRIENLRTEKDWITRDKKIVDAYVNDPFCMQDFSNQFFYDLASALILINTKESFEKSNASTPILIIAGEMDPVGEYGKGPTIVAQKYKEAGVKNVQLKKFVGARHEILNEINREEVYQTVVEWIKKDLLK